VYLMIMTPSSERLEFLSDRKVLAEHIAKCLNEYFQIDPEAIKGLFAHRVPVNEALLEHPMVQCRCGEPPTVSILGVLNGIIGIIPGTDSTGYLCGDYDENNIEDLLGFSVHPKSKFEVSPT